MGPRADSAPVVHKSQGPAVSARAAERKSQSSAARPEQTGSDISAPGVNLHNENPTLTLSGKNRLYHFYPSNKNHRDLNFWTSGVVFRDESHGNAQKFTAPPNRHFT